MDPPPLSLSFSYFLATLLRFVDVHTLSQFLSHCRCVNQDRRQSEDRDENSFHLILCVDATYMYTIRVCECILKVKI